MEAVWRQIRRLIVHDQWHIGLVQCDNVKHMRAWHAPQSVTWLPVGDGTYRADPFIVTHDGKTALFYEEYVFAQDRGRLACREVFVGEDGAMTFGEQLAIDGPRSHRSYPQVFEDGGELWMVPEESACGNIMLYKCVEFPHVWEPVQELLSDFAGVDPTIVKYNDAYWMFVTGARRPNRELHIFTAPQLTGPWLAHKQSPMKSDDHTVRPAGRPFVIDGTLYRPVQDSRETYGGGIILYEVDVLTRAIFAEHRVARFGPWREHMRGMHTLNYDEKSGLCVFDIKTRACFNNVLAKLWAKATRHVHKRYVPATFM